MKENQIPNLDEKMNLLEQALCLLFDTDLSIEDLDFHCDQDEGAFDITITGSARESDDDADEIPFSDAPCFCDDDVDEEEDGPDCLWGIPDIDRVIFNPPATIVIWEDGSKTVVRCMEGEKFERYAGFAAACMKKLFGSTDTAKHIMDDCDEELCKARMAAEKAKAKAAEKAPEKKPEKKHNADIDRVIRAVVDALMNKEEKDGTSAG